MLKKLLIIACIILPIVAMAYVSELKLLAEMFDNKIEQTMPKLIGEQQQPAKEEDVTVNASNQDSKTNGQETESATYDFDGGAVQVIAQPESIPVLVNKQFMLPEDYSPNDLVLVNIPFLNHADADRRKMRSEAAAAIEELYHAAVQQGVHLRGVSAYRSHATQKALFQSYVERDGYDVARTYSALPGTSEHETGLAIDITGADGRCAAEDCFAGTKEAIWLEENAAEFGFIIRYPKGKESITGYKYEPWHMRYVGRELALELMNSGKTLEEYYHAMVVNN